MRQGARDSWVAAEATIVEILGGLLNIAWGLWLVLFNTVEVVDLFLAPSLPFAVHLVWGGGMVALGVAQWGAYMLGGLSGRVAVMSIGAVVWCFIFVVFVFSNYRLPATPAYLVFLVMFGWGAARLQRERREGKA